MPTSTTVIIAAIIAFVVGAAVSGVILFNVGVKHRKQQAEAAIGSAEKEVPSSVSHVYLLLFASDVFLLFRNFHKEHSHARSALSYHRSRK